MIHNFFFLQISSGVWGRERPQHQMQQAAL